MSFVLVSADCSCCKGDGRTLVYQQLAATGWQRINGDTDSAISMWISKLTPGLPEEVAMAQAREDFNSCFNPNCKPRLVFHWGNTLQEQLVA